MELGWVKTALTCGDTNDEGVDNTIVVVVPPAVVSAHGVVELGAMLPYQRRCFFFFFFWIAGAHGARRPSAAAEWCPGASLVELRSGAI